MDLINLPDIKTKLTRAETDHALAGRIWRAIRRQATAAPDEHAWFVPFAAAVTDSEPLHVEAKRILLNYLDALEAGALASSVQFHFWCYAFPHARWAVWFDLVRHSPVWSAAEAQEAAARFVLLQHAHFHSGMLVKPTPECVDNQTASLVLSSLLVGELFAQAPGEGRLARAMRDEALARAPRMIGGMPASGYSGEGSTYQGTIVAYLVPLLVEALARIDGGDWLDRPCEPNGTTARAILEMTARIWQPSGLLLPWDDYGYQFGLKSPLAYLARRTGEPRYLRMLESANWANNRPAGWGYDDPVWALVHWPEDLSAGGVRRPLAELGGR
ncbi:MAG: hypothetical protein ACOC93_05475 [Planctomycetota bacterium]